MKRYNIDITSKGFELIRNESGHFVDYQDYAKLEVNFELAREENARQSWLIANMMTAIEDIEEFNHGANNT